MSTLAEQIAAIEELITFQPGCPDAECYACKRNAERAVLARALIARVCVTCAEVTDIRGAWRCPSCQRGEKGGADGR
jgi:hypothetical protein